MSEAMRSQTLKLSTITEKFGHNPRRDYGKEDGTLEELSGSILDRGVLSPILVRAADPYRMTWYVVAGHRRVAAARQAGLTEVPALCLEYRPKDRFAMDDLALALVENLQRKEMNHMERAAGFARMVDSGLSQAEISKVVGRSKCHVSQTLALMELPQYVQDAVREGALSMMSALNLRDLIKAGKNEMAVNKFAALIAREGMNTTEVRAAIMADRGRADAVPKAQASALATHREVSQWATTQYGSVTKALLALREIVEAGGTQ